jgi:hypothetical protein
MIYWIKWDYLHVEVLIWVACAYEDLYFLLEESTSTVKQFFDHIFFCYVCLHYLEPF